MDDRRNYGSARDDASIRDASNAKLTPEEERVINQCMKDAFYQRALPLGVIGGVTTYMLSRGSGSISKTSWGLWPRTIGVAFLGYVIGKVSFYNVCVKRIMDLPYSPMADRMRDRHAARSDSYAPRRRIFTPPPAPGAPPSGQYDRRNPEIYSDIDSGPYNRYGGGTYDGTTPQYDGLDDSHRPSVDNPVYLEEEMPPMQSHSSSYDDLRRQNREEYSKSMYRNRDQRYGPPSYSPPPAPYSPPPSPYSPQQTPQPPPPSSSVPTEPPTSSIYTKSPTTYVRKNKYGDILE